MIPKPPDSYMLKNLRDVELPEVFSWFPQTIGWKIVFTLVALYAIYRGYRYGKHWWKNRYRKEAIVALQSLQPDDTNWPYKMVKIIKAVLVYLDKQNAALYGVNLLSKMDSLSQSGRLNNCEYNFRHDEATQQWLACTENSKSPYPDFDYTRSRLIVWVNTHQVMLEGDHE